MHLLITHSCTYNIVFKSLYHPYVDSHHHPTTATPPLHQWPNSHTICANRHHNLLTATTIPTALMRRSLDAPWWWCHQHSCKSIATSFDHIHWPTTMILTVSTMAPTPMSMTTPPTPTVSQSEVLGWFYNPNTTPKDKERVVVCLRGTGQELH